MLVLSRKSGQELIIGDNVRITINKISGNRVTLGINAPDEVRIIRGELEPIVKSFEDAESAPSKPNFQMSGAPVDQVGSATTIVELA